MVIPKPRDEIGKTIQKILISQIHVPRWSESATQPNWAIPPTIPPRPIEDSLMFPCISQRMIYSPHIIFWGHNRVQYPTKGLTYHEPLIDVFKIQLTQQLPQPWTPIYRSPWHNITGYMAGIIVWRQWAISNDEQLENSTFFGSLGSSRYVCMYYLLKDSNIQG